MARHERSGNAGAGFETVAGVVAWAGSVIPRVARALDTLGAISSFRAWSKAQGSHPIFLTRIKMWNAVVLPELEDIEDLCILEFGVAYGEASRWWLSRISSPSLKFFGFDLFTGLPRAWRNMPAHAFDAGGNTPSIDDSRVTWIKGDVSSTIQSFDIGQCTGRKFVIFDLDIFEPSLTVWEALQAEFHPGDLIYLDEAFDMDERLLLTSYMLPTKRFDIIASSTQGIVLRCNAATPSRAK